MSGNYFVSISCFDVSDREIRKGKGLCEDVKTVNGGSLGPKTTTSPGI